MREVLEVLSIAAAVVIMVFGFFALIESTYSPWRCSNLGEMTGRDVNHIMFDDCYIEHNGKFIPRDRFIGIQREESQ